jgi:hypothetical protein
VIPLYGFLEGDVLGLLVLAEETDTMSELAAKLSNSASLRVAPTEAPTSVVVAGRKVASKLTVKQAGLGALDRFDVVRGKR